MTKLWYSSLTNLNCKSWYIRATVARVPYTNVLSLSSRTVQSLHREVCTVQVQMYFNPTIQKSIIFADLFKCPKIEGWTLKILRVCFSVFSSILKWPYKGFENFLNHDRFRIAVQGLPKKFAYLGPAVPTEMDRRTKKIYI